MHIVTRNVRIASHMYVNRFYGELLARLCSVARSLPRAHTQRGTVYFSWSFAYAMYSGACGVDYGMSLHGLFENERKIIENAQHNKIAVPFRFFKVSVRR